MAEKEMEKEMNRRRLQRLFDEPIEDIQLLDPGYSGHASDVWSVKLASGEVVVRTSRLQSEPNREFWWGCKYMFGIDPRNMIFFERNSQMVNAALYIPAPAVLDKRTIEGKDYLVVEKMKGAPLGSFTRQSHELLHKFGVWLASMHRNEFDYFGNIAGTKTERRERFHLTVAQAMKQIVEREHPADGRIARELEAVLREVQALPTPKACCPVLVDMDPSQFLTENGLISAIVDIEAYVVAPRELDFVGLEYVMDEEAAASFISGYTTILDIPDLSACRKAYRYLYRLLGVQGSVPLDKWLARPALF